MTDEGGRGENDKLYCELLQASDEIRVSTLQLANSRGSAIILSEHSTARDAPRTRRSHIGSVMSCCITRDRSKWLTETHRKLLEDRTRPRRTQPPLSMFGCKRQMSRV